MTDFSDASNAEIAERTARDVMGWEKVRRKQPYLDHPDQYTLHGYEDGSGEWVMDMGEWDPVNDANHRERLIEQANYLGLAIKVMRYPDGTSDAHVYDTNEDGWPKTGIASSHKEEGRAICEAILEAVEEEEEV